MSDECLSNGDIGDINLFNDIARIRSRSQKCANPTVAAPPLPPYTDIYDSNGILNQLSPVLPNPVIPGTQKKEDTNILDLERQFGLPSFDPTTDTNVDEQDDVCPKDLVGDSQIPVCSTGTLGRDALRLPGEHHYTVYNVRPYSKSVPCVKPEVLWCCLEVKLAPHPKHPPEAPQVPTGFICLDPRIEGIMRWMDTRPGGYKDPWVEDSSLDDGNPLYDSD